MKERKVLTDTNEVSTMLYITKEDMWLSCSYSEPVYDHAPDIASYSVERQLFVPSGTMLELNKRGCVKSIDIDIPFGVSMHPGELTVHDNLLPLVGTVLQVIDEDSVERLMEQRKKEHERREKIMYTEHYLDILSEQRSMLVKELVSMPVLTQEDYITLSDKLWNNARNSVILNAQLVKCYI